MYTKDKKDRSRKFLNVFQKLKDACKARTLAGEASSMLADKVGRKIIKKHLKTLVCVQSTHARWRSQQKETYMRRSNADKVAQLTQKLKEQNDISLKEANWIYSLYSPNCERTKLNEYSSKFDVELVAALTEFYDTVAQKIQQGCRGNFFFSVRLDRNRLDVIGSAIKTVKYAISEYGRPEDFFTELLIDRKTYHSSPAWLKRLFAEDFRSILGEIYLRHTGLYVLQNQRLGAYNYPIQTEEGSHTIAQFINEKKLTPAVTINTSAWASHNYWDLNGRVVFQVAVGADNIRTPWCTTERYGGHREVGDVNAYIIGAYLKYKEVPLVFIGGRAISDRFVITFFTEKDKVKLMKNVFEIPFEEMVKNALHQNIIDGQVAKDLLSRNTIGEFLFKPFVETSMKYIDIIIQREISRETTRKAIQEEDGWLEIGDR